MTPSATAGGDRIDPPSSGQVWTLLHMLRWSTQYLTDKAVPEPRLQAELLLAHALGLERLDLYLQYDRPLDATDLDAFRPLLRRRARREPLQHITGVTAFRALEIKSDARALIPRPETEGLVEEVLRWAATAENPPRRVLEIGTGTGAIALSLWTEADPPLETLVATDVSAEALDLARSNAADLEIQGIEWRLGDGLGPVNGGEEFDVLVSNPPYIGESEASGLEPEVGQYEPRAALFAGPDGLQMIHRIVEGGARVLRPGGLLALEIGAGQGESAAAIARDCGAWAKIRVTRDLSGRDRYLLAASSPSGVAAS